MDASEEKLKDAVHKIETVSSALHSHIGAQTVINESLTRGIEKNAEEIVYLRIDSEKKNGVMELLRADMSRVLLILSEGQNKVLAWINALTPWALVLCGLIYFFITKKGGE